MTARVFHAELWGKRDDKYAWLLEHTVEDTKWTELDPAKPFYLFRPYDADAGAAYHQWPSITEVMPVNVTGVVTARDGFVIDFDEDVLLHRMRTFLDSRFGDREVKERLRLNENYAWRVADARKELRAAVEGTKLASLVKTILYRPFDERLIFWHPSVVWRPRTEAMPHMLAGDNYAIVSARSNKFPIPNHFFCADAIVETKCGEASTQSCTFPLYLYPNAAKVDQHTFAQWAKGKNGRRPNLDPGFVETFAERIGLKFISDGRGDLTSTFGPEDVLHYIYAVFHCPTYRERYSEFLKLDFPRVPLTSDRQQFTRLCELGGELMALHLLESKSLTGESIGYPVAGSDTVEKGYPKYVPPGAAVVRAGKAKLDSDKRFGRVYINPRQFFEGIEPEVWTLQIGGYQVTEKWLKDRRERMLSHDDIARYAKIIEALRGTIRLMAEIDRAIPDCSMR